MLILFPILSDSSSTEHRPLFLLLAVIACHQLFEHQTQSFANRAKLVKSHPSQAQGILPGGHSTQTLDTNIHSAENTQSSSDDDNNLLTLAHIGNSAIALQTQACDHQWEDREKITKVFDPPTSHASCQLELGQLWRARCPPPPITAVKEFPGVNLSAALFSQLDGHGSDVHCRLRVYFNLSPSRKHIVPLEKFGTASTGSSFTVAKFIQAFEPLMSKCLVTSSIARSIRPQPDCSLEDVTCIYGRSTGDHDYEIKASSDGLQIWGMVSRVREQQMALFLNSATAVLIEGCLVHRDHHSILSSITMKCFSGLVLEVNLESAVFYNPVLWVQAPRIAVCSGKELGHPGTPHLGTDSDKHASHEKTLAFMIAPSLIGNLCLAGDNPGSAQPKNRNHSPQIAASDARSMEAEEERRALRADLGVANGYNEDPNRLVGIDQQTHTHTDCHTDVAEAGKSATAKETVISGNEIKDKPNTSNMDGENLCVAPRTLKELVQDFGNLTICRGSSKQDGQKLCLEKLTEGFKRLTIRKTSDTKHTSEQKEKRPSSQSVRPTHTTTKHTSLSRDLKGIVEGASNATPPIIPARSMSVSSTDSLYDPSMASSTTSLSSDNAEGMHTQRSKTVSPSTIKDHSPSGNKAVSQEVVREISQHTITSQLTATSNFPSTLDHEEAVPPSTSNSESANASSSNKNEERSFTNSNEENIAPNKVTSTTLLSTEGSASISGKVSTDVGSRTTHPNPTISSLDLGKEEYTTTDLVLMKEDGCADQQHGQEPITPQVQPEDTSQCERAYNGTSRTSLPAIQVNVDDMDVELSDSVGQSESDFVTSGNDLVDVDLDEINLEGLDPFGEPIEGDMECQETTPDGDPSHTLNVKTLEDDHLMLDSGEVTNRDFLDSSPLANGTTINSKINPIEVHSDHQVMEDINHEAPSKATEHKFTDQNLDHNSPESIGTALNDRVDDHDMSDVDLMVSATSQTDDIVITKVSPVADLTDTLTNPMSNAPSYPSRTNEANDVEQGQMINNDMALFDQNIRQASRNTQPISDMGFGSAINTGFHLDGSNRDVRSGSQLGKNALSGDVSRTVVDPNLASEPPQSLFVRKRDVLHTKFAVGLRHNSNHKAAKQKKGIRRNMPQDDFSVRFAAAPGALDQIPTSSTVCEDITKAVEALSLSPEVCELADEIAAMFDAEAAAEAKASVEGQAWAQAQIASDTSKAPEISGSDVIKSVKDDASRLEPKEGAPTQTELDSGTRVQESPKCDSEAKSSDDSVKADVTSFQDQGFHSRAQTSEYHGDIQAQNIVNQDTVMAPPSPCALSSASSSSDSPKASKRKHITEDDEEDEGLPEPVCEEKLKKHRVTEKNDGPNPVLKGGVTYEDVISAIPPKYKFSRIDVDMVIYLT